LARILGAHIPDLSSEVEFFDVLYLGIFIILSPAFDHRFYYGRKPPLEHLREMANAIRHFHSLLHIFSNRFIVVLEGEVVSHSYVVDRMLGEFAAASAVLAQGVNHENITSLAVRERIEEILLENHHGIVPYYSRCMNRGQKDFFWTGPKVQIIPRSDAFISLIPLITPGEMLDLPCHQIYTEDLDAIPPVLPETAIGKRRGGSPNGDQRKKKRCR
jgi:hypothetical protein